jgi:hypothetical protein
VSETYIVSTSENTSSTSLVHKGQREGRSPKKGRDPDHHLPSRYSYK